MRNQRGSVLLLFPAAVLVVFVLGVICVDAASAYLARRALVDQVTESADSVSAQALDLPAFYGTPAVLRIDALRAQQILADRLALQRRDGSVVVSEEHLDISPDGRQVTVSATGRARTVFAFGPARRRFVVLRAQATATVHEVVVHASP